MKKNNYLEKQKFLNKTYRVTKNSNFFQNKFGLFKKISFLRKKIYYSNKSYAIKKTSWLLVFFWLFIFSLLIISLKQMESQFIDDVYGYLSRTFGSIFSFENNDPDYDKSVLNTSLVAILSTIKVSIAGTLIGVLLSIPTSFLSARNLVGKWYINKPVRITMALMRTFPPVILASILALGFSPTTAATIVIISISWSGMNKILYEDIESIDMSVYYSMISMGYTKLSAFRQTILKKISGKFIEMGLYHFEVSIRVSAILGVIGGMSGIGQIIRSYSMDAKYWGFLGIPIALILFTVLIIETFSTLIRIFILEKKNKTFDLDELNSFTSKRNYLLNVINKKYQVNINNSRNKLVQKWNLFLKNTRLKFLKKKYELINKNKIHKIMQDKIQNTKDKYDEKIEKKRSILKNNKNVKKRIAFENTISDYQNRKKQDIARITSWGTAKNKVVFIYKSYIPNIFYFVFIILILSGFIWSVNSIDFSTLKDGKMNIWLSHLGDFDWNIVKSSNSETGLFPLLSEALLLSLLATFIGGIGAFILGACASRNITSFFAPIFQFLILVFRSFPSFLIAVLVAPIFQGSVSIVGAIALGTYSIGMLGKLVKIQFDKIDKGPIYAIISQGGRRLDAFRLAILPQVLPNILSVSIYRWELNLKQTVAVGIVGASKFGNRYAYTLEHNLYSEGLTYLWGMVLTVIVLEFISNIVRKYIVDRELPAWIKKINKILLTNKTVKQKIMLHKLGYNLRDLNKFSVEAYYELEWNAIKEKNVYLIFQKFNKEIENNNILKDKYNNLVIENILKSRESYNLRKELWKIKIRILKNEIYLKWKIFKFQISKPLTSYFKDIFKIVRLIRYKNSTLKLLKNKKRNKINNFMRRNEINNIFKFEVMDFVQKYSNNLELNTKLIKLKNIKRQPLEDFL